MLTVELKGEMKGKMGLMIGNYKSLEKKKGYMNSKTGRGVCMRGTGRTRGNQRK